MKTILKFTKNWIVALIFSAFAVSIALFQTGFEGAAIALPIAQASVAKATLSDPSGASQLAGEFSASETAEGLQIEASITGAPPGYHGIHIHDKGSCADAGNAAGGHFNPDGVKHGDLLRDGFANAHAGDLGNIFIYNDGIGSLSKTVPGLRLSEGKYAVSNHAVIVHGNRDDFGQPTGNAGNRIGCGILAGGTQG